MNRWLVGEHEHRQSGEICKIICVEWPAVVIHSIRPISWALRLKICIWHLGFFFLIKPDYSSSASSSSASFPAIWILSICYHNLIKSRQAMKKKKLISHLPWNQAYGRRERRTQTKRQAVRFLLLYDSQVFSLHVLQGWAHSHTGDCIVLCADEWRSERDDCDENGTSYACVYGRCMSSHISPGCIKVGVYVWCSHVETYYPRGQGPFWNAEAGQTFCTSAVKWPLSLSYIIFL